MIKLVTQEYILPSQPLTLESAALDLWEYDINADCFSINTDRLINELGYSVSGNQHHIHDIYSYIHPQDVEHVKETLRRHLQGLTEQFLCDFRLRSNNHGWIWHTHHARVIERMGREKILVGVSFNVEDRKQQEAEREILLRTLKMVSKSSMLLNNLQTAIVVYQPDGRIIFSNPRAVKLLGLSETPLPPATAVDSGWHFINEHNVRLGMNDYPVNLVITSLKPVTGLILGIKTPTNSNASWLLVNAFPEFNHAGILQQIVIHFEDITASKQASEKIYRLAFFDDLTGLPNRRLLMEQLHAALQASARSKKYGAVLFIDMDKFKTINDVMGHDYGDLLLMQVADRIQSHLRKGDVVARMSGDEFVVIIAVDDVNNILASKKIAALCETIRQALSQPYYLHASEQHSSPSIGIVMFNNADTSPEILLRQSDMAMYSAKDAGRNTYRFFNPEIQQLVETRALLETDLRNAVPEQQLCLLYQIQVDNQLQPIGAEAQVRWLHPTRGMILPMQFIPIAEESALIHTIGNWVLTAACEQLAAWSTASATQKLTLSVNVSAQQFRQYNFVENMTELLHHYQINPSRLKLELTESVVLNDINDVVGKMHLLKKLGVQLSMDDFGTGYSSLSYLKQLPLDQVKIDQSFVRDITIDPNDAIMVKTIIDLANNFRLDVIAEGVENTAQLDFLIQHGCKGYQGYLFSMPVGINEFNQLITDSSRTQHQAK